MKGWFKFRGRDGDRTLAEQMQGLASALAESNGKTVLDLGCAEGLIAFEFAKAGANVTAIDYNADLVKVAVIERRKLEKPLRKRIALRRKDLNDYVPDRRFDIVLALAVVHKMNEPARAVQGVADSSSSLVVYRLPVGSSGAIVSKHTKAECDLNAIMQDNGYRLERTEEGPRTELVQYWRRENVSSV